MCVSKEYRIRGNERRENFIASHVKLAAEGCQGTALSKISFQYFAANKIQCSG